MRYFLSDYHSNIENKKIKLKISMFEIYLDTVYDLLAQNKINS